MFKKLFDKSKNNTKGTSLAFMVVMVSSLVIVGAAMLVVIIGFYKLNIMYAKSEELYYKTDKVSEMLTQKLEEKSKSILDTVKIYNESNDHINSDLVSLIKADLLPSPSYSYTETQIEQKLIGYIKGSSGEAASVTAQRNKFSKALYDVAFKLQVHHEQQDSGHNSILTSDADGNGHADNIKDVFSASDIPELGGTNQSIEISSIYVDKALYPKLSVWLQAVMGSSTLNDVPDYFTETDTDGKPYYEPYEVKYEITTVNYPKKEVSKKIHVAYQLSSTSFTVGAEVDKLKSENSVVTDHFTNMLLDGTETVNDDASPINGFEATRNYALLTTKDLEINSSNSNVTINGDIYAFGSLPDAADFSNPIIDESKYKGIIINGDNSNVTVQGTGKTLTRGYLNINANNAKFVTKDLVCDTLYVADKSFITKTSSLTVPNVQINGNLSTFDDVRINGNTAYVKIAGNYYGLHQGDGNIVNRSSSLLLNNISSRLEINGDTLIGGVAFIKNIIYPDPVDPDKAKYSFKTGESATIGDNYKAYMYKIDPSDGPSSSDPIYHDTVHTPTHGVDTDRDFHEWKVREYDASGNIEEETSTKMLTQFSGEDYNGTDPRTDDSSKELLKRHLYYYSIKSNPASSYSDTIQYNFTVNRGNVSGTGAGIYLNMSKSIYAPGIITANGTSYWGDGTLPWTTSPITGSNFTPTTIVSGDYYLTNVNEGELPKAEFELQAMKDYAENSIGDANAAPTKEVKYTDNAGVLTSSPVTCAFGGYYCYLTNAATNFTISNGGSGTIRRQDIDGKTGIIYTKGKITIDSNQPISFNGTIIALGGIEINTDQNIIITYNSTVKNDIMDHLFNDVVKDGHENDRENIRRFFAPGNKSNTFNAQDIYRGTNKNIRIIDKRLIYQNEIT